MIGQPQQKDDKKQEVKEAAAKSSKKRKVTPAAAAACEDQITLTQIVRGKKPSDTAAASTKYETEEANNEGIMVGCLW